MVNRRKKKRQQRISDIGNRSALQCKNRPSRPITTLPTHSKWEVWGFLFFFFKLLLEQTLIGIWLTLPFSLFFFKVYLNSHTFYNEDFSVGFSAGYHLVLLTVLMLEHLIGKYFLVFLKVSHTDFFFLNFCLVNDRRWHYYIHTLKVKEQQQ